MKQAARRCQECLALHGLSDMTTHCTHPERGHPRRPGSSLAIRLGLRVNRAGVWRLGTPRRSGTSTSAAHSVSHRLPRTNLHCGRPGTFLSLFLMFLITACVQRTSKSITKPSVWIVCTYSGHVEARCIPLYQSESAESAAQAAQAEQAAEALTPRLGPVSNFGSVVSPRTKAPPALH